MAQIFKVKEENFVTHNLIKIFYQDVLPVPSTEDDSDIEIPEVVVVKVKDKLISGIHSKPINIQWIRTSSHPKKLCLAFYPVFYEHKNCTIIRLKSVFLVPR